MHSDAPNTSTARTMSPKMLALAATLLAALSLLGGCAAHLDQSALPVSFDEIRELHIEGLEADGVALRCSVAYSFKDDATLHTIELSDVEARLAMGREEVGTATAEALTLNREGPRVVDLQIKLPYEKVTETLLELVRAEEVSYGAGILATVDSMAGVKMTAEMQGKLKLPKDFALQVTGALTEHHFRMSKAYLTSLSMRGVDLVFAVQLKNPFRFPIELERISYRATLSGADVGKGAHSKTKTLTPGDTTELRVKHHAPPNPLALMALMATKPPYRVRLRGEVHMKPIAGMKRLPFDVEIDIPNLGGPKKPASKRK